MVFKWRLIALAKGIRLEQIAQETGKGLPYISRASRGLVKVNEPLKARIAQIVGIETERGWRKVNG